MADLFVAPFEPGLGEDGDGTRAQPFRDPWLAFWHAQPGDRIHVASGVYTGRCERSSWVVDTPRLTVLGGYDRDFRARDPWRRPTVLGGRRGLRVPREPSLLQGMARHEGLVLDGLFFDAADRLEFDDEGGWQRTPYGESAMVDLRGDGIVIRNCVFANGGAGAADIAGAGALLENNLWINCLGSCLLGVRDAPASAPAVIRQNTFAFAHDGSDPPRGQGADRAVGVRIRGAADLSANVFIACGNAAIACFHDLGEIAVDHNLFFASPRDIVRSRVQGAEAEVTEAHAWDLEDVGLRSAIANRVADPGCSGMPPAWLDATTTDLAATYARPPRSALDVLRASAMLPALPVAPATDAQRPPMVRLGQAEALAFAVACTQGHHAVVPAADDAFAERAAEPTYQRIGWPQLRQPDPSLEGVAVEIIAGLGFDQQSDLLPGLAESHIGMALYEPGTDGSTWRALLPLHGTARHQADAALRYSRGMDVEATHRVRGTYRAVEGGGRQPVTLVVDAVLPNPVAAAIDEPVATGRDWFVRSDASGGDGSREAPFRDPFQALAKAAPGDRILVAGGEYRGRLRSGAWKIPVPHLALLGGWDTTFAARDPWRFPVRFVLDPETLAKGIFGDPILSGDGSVEGLMLDGFVFDGSSYNTYKASGTLDAGHSHSAALVELLGGNGSITVRNCVFVNAARNAVQINAARGCFENNVVLNTSGTAVRIQAAGAGPWLLRSNTLAFAADPTARASSGQSTSGCLLDLSGRAQALVASSVFAFADSIAIRATVPIQGLSLEGNVLAGNLFADISDGRHLLIDAANRERVLPDAPFASLQGNSFALPAVPIDAGFAREAVGRLSALSAAMPKDGLEAAAAALGVRIVPEAAPPDPAPAPEPTRSSGEPSIADLLADLGRARLEFENKAAPPAADAEPSFCPRYPVEAALKLVLDAAPGQAGARPEIA